MSNPAASTSLFSRAFAAERPATLAPIGASLLLVTQTETPCGIEAFTRRAFETLNLSAPGRHVLFDLTGAPGETERLHRALDATEALIVNLPLVAWKRQVVAPLKAMAAARRRGKQVIVMLHEWADLDWKRRATYLAYLPFATRLLFSSPHVQVGFERDRLVSWLATPRGLVPIPANLARPARVPATELSRAMERHRTEGKLVIGHFGSIYPKKQSGDVLDIAAALKARGTTVHVAFVGSFVKGGTDPEPAFRSRAAALGLADDVTVTGYIGPDAEVFAALEACDVFVYRFAEGLTSRRGSVLACLQAGRPVLVNAGTSDAEFGHHAAYRSALDRRQLELVPLSADAAAFASRLLDVRGRRFPADDDTGAHWRAAAAALLATPSPAFAGPTHAMQTPAFPL